MELRGRKILVTGGAGFIGSNLVDALILNNNDVTVLDDFSTGKRENLASANRSGRLNIVEGSILDYELVRMLTSKMEVVFHLAVQCLRECFNRPHYVHEVNATGSLNLLRAAQENQRNVERFIYVSSSEVYGTAKTVPMTELHELLPTTVYGASKLAGELYTNAFHITWGLPTVIVRPFNTYGYREHHEGASGEVIPRFVVRILNGLPPVIFGEGSQTRDFTFVTDTVEGLIKAAATTSLVGQTVNVACGKEITIKEIAERLLSMLNRSDLRIQWQSERPGDVHRHFADTSKLSRETGFKAGIDIEKGLELYLDWFRSQYSDPSKLLSECQDNNWNLHHAEVLTSTAS